MTTFNVRYATNWLQTAVSTRDLHVHVVARVMRVRNLQFYTYDSVHCGCLYAAHRTPSKRAWRLWSEYTLCIQSCSEFDDTECSRVFRNLLKWGGMSRTYDATHQMVWQCSVENALRCRTRSAITTTTKKRRHLRNTLYMYIFVCYSATHDRIHIS